MADKETKAKKKKGIIRTEAVVPFLIIVLVIFVYFHFFFDYHLKKAFEFAGYQLLGAEVDIDNVETNFLKGTFRVQGIQVTNSEKPTHNMVQIGDIRFGVLWDGLLRARIIVDEMAAEQIQIDVPRKRPGRVKPVEVEVETDSNKPSALDKFKGKALNRVENKYSNNALGDIAAVLGGTSGSEQLGKIEGSLASKARLKEIEADYQAKQKKWQEKIQALPKGPEIQSLADRLSKVKTKDFKSPQELQQSLQEIDSIMKEADAKYKAVQSVSSDLTTDLKTIDQNIKELDALVKKDVQDLETRFHLPKLDAKSLTESIFFPYIEPYIAKFNRYRNLAQKYAPPKLLKKGKKDETANNIQPHPRAKGVTYEFTRTTSYPLFWIKKILVTSQAGPGLHSGNIKGLVTDVTSNQTLIGKPTIAHLEGTVPDLQVSDFVGELTIDKRKEPLRLGYDFKVGSYGLDGKELVQSPDVQIAFNKATGSLASKGELLGLRDFSFTLNNQFKNVDYSVTSKNPTVEQIVKSVFASLPAITLNADGQGQLPGLSVNLSSNLGPELSKGFEKQLQQKLAEGRAQLQAYVNNQVGNEKAKFEAEFNKSKSQIEGEIKKVQAQLDAEKAKAQAKVDQSKKDAENQVRKGAEDQLKKALPDDLKKRLGF